MNIDLHVHTSYSDSSFSPEQTCIEAKKNGITHMAICDHDTVSGLEESEYYCNKHGIVMIPGVEISAYDFSVKRKVHVLGYFFSLNAEKITGLCEPLLIKRTANTLTKTIKLIEAGFPITFEEVKEEAGKSSAVYKQHIMSVLMKKGITDRVYSDLYYRIFGKGGICEKDITYVDVFNAISAIRKDGGKAVVAHAAYSGVAGHIEKYVSFGIDGVEIYHPGHTASDISFLENQASEFDLKVTGGSDYHGFYGDTDFNERFLTSEVHYRRLI